MINLLPYVKQREIKAGRANVTVVNYILITIGGLVLLSLIVAGAYATLIISRTNAQNRVDAANQQATQYAATKQAAASYRSDLSTAKQIIDSQVNYSPLLIKIAQAVPRGVTLDALALSPTSFGQPTTISAHAQDYTQALALRDSFIKHSDLFSGVTLLTLQGSDSSSGNLPVSVSLSVTINKGALQ